ncbi:MAG: hypothetical protein QM674_20500 [Burkholderiaceae bacterium]
MRIAPVRSSALSSTSLRKPAFARLWLRSWAACALLLLAPALGHAARKEFLEFPMGTNFEVEASSTGARTVRIPVATIDKATALDRLKVRIQDVARKEIRQAEVTARFAIDPVAATSTATAAFVVKLDVPPPAGAQPATLQVGDYAVTVLIGLDLDDPTADNQLVLLKITISSAKLTGKPFQVGRVLGMFGNDDDIPGTLILTESTGRVAVSAIRASVDRNPPARPDEGALDLQALTGAIAAGQPRSFSIKTNGKFPLGESTGTLNLLAPELDASVPIVFKVFVRRDYRWILVLTVAGSLVGWSVRIKLAQRKLRLSSKLDASIAIEALQDAVVECQDAPFRRALSRLRTDLQTSVDKDAPAAITAKAKATLDAMVGERTKLEQRLAPFVLRSGWLQALLRINRTIPSPVAVDLEILKKLADQWQQQVQARDAQSAAAHEAAVDRSLSKVADTVCTYGADLARYLTALTSSQAPPIRTDVITGLRALAATSATDFPWAAFTVGRPTDEAMQTLLANLEKAVTNAAFLVAHLHGLAVEFLLWADDVLPPSGAAATQRAELDPLTEAELKRDLLWKEVNAPATGIGLAQVRADKLEAAWQTYLDAVVPATPVSTPPAPPPWLAALRSREWEKAVDLAVAATGVGAAIVARARSAASNVLTQAAASDSVLPGYLREPVVLVGGVRERRELTTLIADTTFLQTALTWGVFVVGTFAVYADSWVGTYREMFALFTFAFGVDLSVDSMLAAMKDPKPKT